MTKSIFLPALLCFFACPVFAQTLSFSWVKPVFGATQTAPLNAVMTDLEADPAGNTYITGEFKGQLNFGLGITLTGTGGNSTLYLAKYAPDGTVVWAKKCDPVVPDDGFTFHKSSKIAVDAVGNIYWSASYTANALDFGNGISILRTCTNNGCGEGFLLKLNTNGNVIFQKAIHAALNEQLFLENIACDLSGRHYLTGFYSGNELWLQGGANLGGLTTEGYFLCAYSPEGTAEWIAFQTAASATPSAQTIAVSPDGERIAVSGTYNAFQLDFSNGAVTSSNAIEKRFVVWYNKSGQPVDAGTLAASENLQLFDIKLDNQYRAWIAGNYSGTLEWNEEAMAPPAVSTSAGIVGILPMNGPGSTVVKIDHTIFSVPVNTLTLGPGDTYFSGGLAGEQVSVPGGSSLENNGCLDAILLSGTAQMLFQERSIGGAGCEKFDNFYFGSAMAIDQQGGLLFGGTFENGGTFGLNNLNGNGLWVAKLSTGLVNADEPVVQKISVQPNPAAHSVQLTFPENAAGHCRILSVTGRIMAEMPVQATNLLEVAAWPAGIYLLEFTDLHGNRTTEKLLVQH